MIAKITSKRQVTFPAKVLDDLGLRPGDSIELIKTATGYLLRPKRIDATKLAPLSGEIRRDRGVFDVDRFRDERHDPSLRD